MSNNAIVVTNNNSNAIVVTENATTNVALIQATGPQGIAGPVSGVDITSTGGTINVTGTALSETNPSGTFNVDLPQSIAASSSPTFTDLTLSGTTASSSTTTGALTIAGGVGVGGAIYAGSIQDTPIGSSTKSTGAFTTLTASGVTTLTAGTASTSATTGTLVITGGLGVSGNIYTNSTITSTYAIQAVSSSSIGITVESTGTATSAELNALSNWSGTPGTGFSRIELLTDNSSGNSGWYIDSVGNSTASPSELNFKLLTNGTQSTIATLTTSGNLSAPALYDNSNRVVTSIAAGTDISTSGSSPSLTVNCTSTLATVTGRGASTSTALTANAFIPSSATVPTNGLYLSGTNQLAFAANSGWVSKLDVNGLVVGSATYVPASNSATSSNYTLFAGVAVLTTTYPSISFNEFYNTTTDTWQYTTNSNYTYKIRSDNAGNLCFYTAGAGTINTNTTETLAMEIVTGSNSTSTGGLSIARTTASSSTSTGALIVSGGVGIGGTCYATTFNGPLTGNASTATNIASGTTNQIPYQTGAGVTSFFSAANYGVHIYGSSGTPSSIAGAAGVLQGSASANPTFTTTPTLTGTNFSGIPNGALTNSSVTIGSTSLSLGSSATTIAGLTSVTSTTFVGALTGTASTATNIAGGSTDSLVYQIGSGATGFIAAGTNGYVLQMVSGVPTWASISASDATNISGGAAGELPYQSASSTTAFTAAGTSGQALLSGGTGSPTWSSVLSISSGTVNISAGANNSLAITNSSSTPYAITMTRSDLSNTVGLWNNTGLLQVSASIQTATGLYYSNNGSTQKQMMNDANDGWLRLNNANNFTNGVYTPGNSRVDGSTYFGADANISAYTGSYGSILVTGLANGSYYGVVLGDSRGSAFMSNGSNVGIYTNSGTGAGWVFYDTGTNTNFSHNIVCSGTITGSSDVRLKKDITPIKDALDKVRRLTGVMFTRTATDERETGLVANDVEKVLPEAVKTDPDGFKSLAYGNLAGLLVEAIKIIDERLSRLEGERA